MSTIEIILSIVTTVLGGTNLLQLINNRHLRDKMMAEADQAQNETWNQIIAGQTKEIARLQKNYGELQEKYYALAEEMQQLKAQLAGANNTSSRLTVKVKK